MGGLDNGHGMACNLLKKDYCTFLFDDFGLKCYRDRQSEKSDSIAEAYKSSDESDFETWKNLDCYGYTHFSPNEDGSTYMCGFN